jgi:2-polyprenyl-3-methyl-5-hydroxy-6-metoxy-1,4-benzoquinol methylase
MTQANTHSLYETKKRPHHNFPHTSERLHMPKPENDYVYPDVDDKITSSLIHEKEGSKGQWESSEKEALNTIKQTLKETPYSWFFDAGCGTGRLLPEFQSYFTNILAVDPDASQIEKAKLLVKNHGFSKKVTFKVAPIEMLQWKKESLDVALCSHVLQHVGTGLVEVILQKFNELLRAKALLFILTAHSQKEDYYVKDFLKQQEVCEEVISKVEFNSLIANKESMLPIHFFSIESLQKEVRKAGFELLDTKLFHCIENSDSQGSARDMLLVCRKLVSPA